VFLDALKDSSRSERETRRAGLDRFEKTVIGEAFNEDKFCREDVSAGLERTICHSELTRILSSDLMWDSRVLQSESEVEDETRTVIDMLMATTKMPYSAPDM
jgi:hypothetical protein